MSAHGAKAEGMPIARRRRIKVGLFHPHTAHDASSPPPPFGHKLVLETLQVHEEHSVSTNRPSGENKNKDNEEFDGFARFDTHEHA